MRARLLAAALSIGFAVAACSDEAVFELEPPDGERVASTIDAIDNECQPVTGSGTNFTLQSAPSEAWSERGRHVFLLQVAESFAEDGADNDTGAPGGVGVWDLVPISEVVGTTLVTALAAEHAYVSGTGAAAQACLVREYSELTLETDVVPRPWNGASGGVLVFSVSRRLHFEADTWIDASESGFVGGIESGDEVSLVATTSWDATPSTGGGKGRGIDTRSGTRFGRGSYRNAGGGGNRRRGAGGGGAGAGNGGPGEDGLTTDSGGLGGHTPDSGAGIERLFFGGGGGGGHSASVAVIAGTGGSGGGLVLVRAREISLDGAGGFRANGGKGGAAITGAGGGGGGGGGAGTIVVWAERDPDGDLSCEAHGRAGGTGLGQGGIGGGGGGGACWTSFPSLVNVSGGAAAFAGGSGSAGVSGVPGSIPFVLE